MKRSFAALATLAIFSIVMIGCGEDDTPTVQVNQYLKFNVGDQFTYNYYDRDPSNARVDSTKKVLVWTVLQTDINFENRDVVTEIQQIKFEADGTTPIDTTMVYFVANGQGQLQQYNLLQMVVGQFSSETLNLQPVIAQIPNTWIQVSDTKSPSALNWNASNLLDLSLNDVEVAGGETLDAKLQMGVNSNHKGKVTTTVEAGTYDDAFITDHLVPTTILGNEDKTIGGVIEVTKGSPIIRDTMALHYAVSISGGILSQTMDSKTTAIVPLPLLTYPIPGFEMELTSVTRATTN